MADMMSYINTGWVKVMRSIINSRSYDVPNALAAYCHCLMRANIKPGKVKGVFLKRGQFITGNDSFASECGLSPKQMRIALDMLEDDGLITREPIASRANKGADNRANKSKKSGTLITVVNYDFEDIPVISGYVNQGEQQGEQLVSDEGEQQGNSIRNRIREEIEYKDRVDKECPVPEGNTRGVLPSSPDQISALPKKSKNYVMNPDAKKLAAVFTDNGFVYDGDGGGGLEGYIAQQLSAGVPEAYLLETLEEYQKQENAGRRIRKHMAYFHSVLSEVIESHNQCMR